MAELVTKTNQTKQTKQFPLTTVGALVTGPSDRVLIVRTTKWRGTWGVPGGKVDWGETLEAALIREFQEEVGLNLTDIKFALLQEAVLDQQFHKPAHFVLLNYYARSDREAITTNEEIAEWAWVEPHTALEYPLNTFTQVLVKDYLAKHQML
ncbi:NUDIX hydrolase [Thalassoporum mexicanum PCC 7367]|uniref:NUDIX domain-containing protein n=1 Tax=Thalassoporum mexicanum TaxID=3457544 RepID=UPI00029FCB13|nr:NUDIX domain-containing protein [Pseudanabaena sp. PCC 7367]AFY70975.1 NUDIX hydrolase [Pseudanabaena sp. PCC 7367]